MPGKIFISYRRDDVKADARGIYDRLATRYGTAGVFMDVRDLSGGQVFDKVIADALAESDVLLAVIGPNWMNLLLARMAAGGRDLMREEIATALERNLIIIPVLIERTPVPDANSLPADIRPLAAIEVEDVRFKYFDRDMENITAVIDRRREERARREIRNSEQLWLWIRKRPIEVPRAIAARGALRALPWACDKVERLVQKRAQATAPPPATIEQADQGLTPDEQEYRQAMQAYAATEEAGLEKADGHLLNVFRATAVTWFAAVGSNHVTDEVKAAARSAAGDIEPLSFDIRVAPAAHNAAMTTIADIARTRTATLHLEPAGRYAAKAADPVRFGALDATGSGLVGDLEWFDRNQAGPELTAKPLWRGVAAPEEWAARWQRLRTAMLILDPSWEVWTKWYDDRVSGAPFDVGIERKRVLVPAEVWSQPPASVNAYIARLIA